MTQKVSSVADEVLRLSEVIVATPDVPVVPDFVLQ